MPPPPRKAPPPRPPPSGSKPAQDSGPKTYPAGPDGGPPPGLVDVQKLVRITRRRVPKKQKYTRLRTERDAHYAKLGESVPEVPGVGPDGEELTEAQRAALDLRALKEFEGQRYEGQHKDATWLMVDAPVGEGESDPDEYTWDEDLEVLYKGKEAVAREAQAAPSFWRNAPEVDKDFSVVDESDVPDEVEEELDVDVSGSDFAAQYDLGDVISTGPYSMWQLATEKSSGHECLVKLVAKATATDMGVHEGQFEEESKALKLVKHENAASLRASFETPKVHVIVSDGASGGEILQQLSNQDAEYGEADARALVRQILSVVAHLHEKSIVHRDIAPENFFFAEESSNNKPVLSDFTFARIGDPTDDDDLPCGNSAYQAPEIVDHKEHGKPADVWSVGVLTYILLSGSAPFNDSNTMRLRLRIRKAQFQYPEVDWDFVSADAKDFVAQLIVADPASRPTASEALKHPWLAGSGGEGFPNFQNNLYAYLESL